MLRLLELLRPRGLDTNARIKLVRHQDKRVDIQELEREGFLEIYQSYQSKPVFDCDFLVVFTGLENSRARFFGVYRVGERSRSTDKPLPAGFKYPELCPADGYYYELHVQPSFNDLTARLVVDWGDAALAWHQWLTDKEVTEILPTGYVRPFPGYDDIFLSYNELVGIIKNPAANREWHRMLSAVAGVYLIVDGVTGKQYVGSASGESGILGRWRAYADGGHGGNDQLIKLIDADIAYARNFSFSILRTLPRTMTRTEVVSCECLYKTKLGSRAFGLNSN
jgi:hypothetical protein